MKKVLSLLLTAVMLLALIPSVLFSANADDTGTQIASSWSDFVYPEGVRIIQGKVTSATSVYCTSNNRMVDLSAVPLNGVFLSNPVGARVGDMDGSGEAVATDVCIVGEFPQAERVSAFVIKNNRWMGRINNFRVSFSQDGQTWTEIVTFTNVAHGSTAVDTALLYILPTSLANVAYQYVKIEKTNDIVGQWIGLSGIAFLNGTTVRDSRLVKATHTESYNNDFVACWNGTNTTQLNNTEANVVRYTSAKLEAPTVIDQIAIDFGPQGARLRTSKLYGSVDGILWEEIAALSSVSYNNTTQFYTVNSNQAYSFVKLEQGSGYMPYAWSVLRVSVYGYSENATRIAAVNVPSLNVTADTSNPPIDLWSDTNTVPRSGSDTDTIIEATVAKFTFPTKISTIYLVSGNRAGRNRGIRYEGSMDGENWELICDSGHQNNAQYNNATKKVTVNGSRAYLYIRAKNILQNGADKDWHWDVINLAVYGEEVGVTVYGTQSKISPDGATYGVRIISTVDYLCYDRIGYEITATGEGISTPKYWDRTTTYVYASVYETVEGVPVERDAAYFGGAYISAIPIVGISVANYGSITFTVRPYVETDLVKLYSAPFTAIYHDGEYRYIPDPYDVSVADGTDVRVMSCNVLAEWDGYWDGGQALSPVSTRMGLFSKMIEVYCPTVIGLQEFSPSWYLQFNQSDLSSAWAVLKFENPNFNDGRNVCTTVMYRSDLYTLTDSGCTFYTDASNINCNFFTWGVLQDKTTGKTFCLVSTHWNSAEEQIAQAAQLTEFVNARKASCPVIVAGDFNANENTQVFGNFLSGTGSLNGKYAADEQVNNIGSYHGFGSYTPSAFSCDHITVTADANVLKFETTMYHEQIFISDHAFPIADILLPN